MKALSLLSVAAALVPAVVKAAGDNEGCAACKTAEKAYCYYKVGTDSVVGVCVEKTATAATDCPALKSLSDMYKSLPDGSEFTAAFVKYDAAMVCTEEEVGAGVLLPMAAEVTTKAQMDNNFDDCMTAPLAWCNYEPKDKTAGGYCGADATQDCPTLAKFGGIDLTASNGGKAVTTSACTDCTTDFCGYLNGNTVAYAVCLPKADPARTACPALTSMDAMYKSIGVTETDLTSTFVSKDNHASGCGKFNALSTDLVMSVKSSVINEVFEKATCDDCVKTKDAQWCNYVPTKAETTGDEKEGGYCGADSSCVKLENANQYAFNVSEPLTTCPSTTSTKAPSAAYPTAIVSTSFVMVTSLVGVACM